MKQLAYVIQGFSQYEDKLWDILNKFSSEHHLFQAFSKGSLASPIFHEHDYCEYLPFFVLAGATIKPAYTENEMHHTKEKWLSLDGYTIEIEEDKEEDFYSRFKNILEEYK